MSRCRTLALAALALTACTHAPSAPDLAHASPTYGGAAAPAAEAPSSAAPSHRARDAAPAYDEAIAYERGGGEASAGASASAPAPRRSAGLGTAYGETRSSQVRQVAFVRQSASPDAVLQLRYNDPDGIADLSAWRTGQVNPPPAAAAYGALRIALLDERGDVLPAVDVAGQTYAVGQSGARYRIGVANDTPARYEVVASVDGLDVLDGQEASLAKRGYVVDPYTSFVIEGWRTSDDTVAAFRFSEAQESYAARTGKPRSIGVVGVAFFQERAPDYRDLHRRDTADPFPQSRYAPPPPRW